MLFKPFVLFDKDSDSGGGGEGVVNNDDKTAKTYSQAELNAMFAERQQRGATAAITDILKKTGIDTDVAFPLDDFDAGLGGDDDSLAYMSIQELNRHLDTIFMQDLNTVRFEILKALFDTAGYTWADEQWGNLSCVSRVKHDLLSDYLYQQLKSPIIKMSYI
jgi:hypothetical protein